MTLRGKSRAIARHLKTMSGLFRCSLALCRAFMECITMDIEEALKTDVIADIEEVTGKHHSEFSKGEQCLTLLSSMCHGTKKRELLRNAGDTHSSITWCEFCGIMKAEGFKIGYEEVYQYDNFKNPCDEKVILFYNPTKHMIAFAQSYSNIKSVNSISINCHTKEHPQGVGYSGGYEKSTGCWDFHFDGREGLRHNLAKIYKCVPMPVSFVDSWVWFNNLQESKEEGFDYKELNKHYIDKSSPEFKKVFYLT